MDKRNRTRATSKALNSDNLGAQRIIPYKEAIDNRRNDERRERTRATNKVLSRNSLDAQRVIPYKTNRKRMVNRPMETAANVDDNNMDVIANGANGISTGEKSNSNADAFNNASYLDYLDEIAHNLNSIDTTSTERILEEYDLLLAEFRTPDERLNSTTTREFIMDNVITPEPSQECVVSTTSEQTDAEPQPTASGTQTPIANANNAIVIESNTEEIATNVTEMDGSVIVIGDDSFHPCNRQTSDLQAIDVDEEVIFVHERPGRRERIVAIVDLCSPQADKLNHTKDESTPKRTLPAQTSTPQSNVAVKVNCPVCMETINGPPFSTTCGHLFCDLCIKRAIKTRKKCPMCNANLSLKQIHPVYLPV